MMLAIIHIALVWAIFKTIKFFQYPCMLLLGSTPNFKRKVVRILEEDCGIKVTTNPAEKGKFDKTKYSCEMVVHNPKFYKRFALDDASALKETYMVS